MNTTFHASFKRDLKKVRQEKVLAAVRQAILDAEAAKKWNDVPKIKKMKGAADAFRIRVDDYRIGVFIEGNTVEFARLLPRSEIYRMFP